MHMIHHGMASTTLHEIPPEQRPIPRFALGSFPFHYAFDLVRQVGIRYDKLPGEWYGPTTAACVLRDISELYAARLSPRAATRKTSDNAGSCAPPEPPPSSSAKRLRTTADEAGDLSPEEAVCDGASTLEGGAAPQAIQGKKTLQGGRDPGRPAGSAGAGGGGAGSCNGDGGARAGEDRDTGGDRILPSSRPLRVFVSQGDVVYVDEVEAVAIRGGDEAETAAEDPEDDHTCGEQSEQANGKPTGKSGGETDRPRSDTSGTSGDGGERAPPAFFDPLLNPGSSGGQNQDGGAWSSAVLLLVPLRLGLDELSAGYIPSEFHPEIACPCWCCRCPCVVWTWGSLGETSVTGQRANVTPEQARRVR